MKVHTFPKRERIVSRKTLDSLFNSTGSRSAVAFPVRAIYMTEDAADDADAKVQVLVNVSKRRFKHAVDRNRVKRQIREAYRLNKEVLASAVPQGKRVLLAFLWLSDRHSPSATVAARVVSLLKRISKEL